VGEDLNEDWDLSQHSVSLSEESESFLGTTLLQPMVHSPDQGRPPSILHAPEPVVVEAVDRPSQENELCSSDHHDSGHLMEDVMDAESPLPEDPVSPTGEAASNTDIVAETEAQVPEPTVEEGVNESVTVENVNTQNNEIINDPVLEKPVRTLRQRRNKLQESLTEQKAPLVGAWEPVKPHEATPTLTKPPKKGKTCRKPKNEQREDDSKRYRTTAAERRRRMDEKEGRLRPLPEAKVTVPIEE